MTPITEEWLREIGFTNRDAYTLRIEVPCAHEDWTRYLECCDSENLEETGWEIASYNESEALDERALVWDSITGQEQMIAILIILGRDMTKWLLQ